MLVYTDRILELFGVSGKIYRFDIYSFDSFDDLKTAFKQKFPALYLFTKIGTDGENCTHDLIYLGETGDLATRFNHHHKQLCVMNHGANHIGIYAASNCDSERRGEESDLLDSYDFPCNE